MMKLLPPLSCPLLVSLALTSVWSTDGYAQTSVLNLGSGTINWFDANNWSNGVANGAGYAAEIQLAPGAVGAATIGNPATLEQLLVSGRGSVNLAGTGPLNFANDGSGELLLRLAPDGGNLNVTMDVPLAWGATDLLRADVPLQGTLNLNKPFTAAGGIVKSGAGSLRLGANAAWVGGLEITNGVVIAGHAQSLGTTDGVTIVRSSGRLVIEQSTAETLQLDGGVVQLANKNLNGSIVLSESSTIFRPQNPLFTDPRGGGPTEQWLGVTNIYGSISGSGDLTIDNQSRDELFLRGNNTHTGHTYISAGTIYATSLTPFGGAAEGTTLNGGTLHLGAATAEPMYVNGATLNFTKATSSAGPLTLRKGAVILPNGVDYTQTITLDQASDVSISSNGQLSGGIVGTGDVTLRGYFDVNGAPIANDGDLIIANDSSQKIFLQTPNSFSGDLVLLDGEVVLENAQAASRPVKINGGKLTINLKDTNFTQEIRINRGAVESFGEVSGPVILDKATIAKLTGGRFTSVISGKGDVEFSGREENDQTITGSNTFDGIASVVYGVVNANSPTAFGTTDWATVVRNGTLNVNSATNETFYVGSQGTLNLNAPVARLPQMLVKPYHEQGDQKVVVNVPSSFTGPAEAASGRLMINANAAVESLQVREKGRVIVAPGATLDVVGEIDLQEGRMEGSVTGSSVIRKTTYAGAQLANMPQFAGQILVERGVLQIYAGGLGTTAGATRVARGAQLMIHDVSVIADDVYLEDAVGPQNRGGLYMGGDCCGGAMTMTGRLDLGPNGSIIGGRGNPRNGMLRIQGQVHGGSLTTWGSGVVVRMGNYVNPYSGVTDVRQGSVELSGNGRLAHTPKIVVHESEGVWDGSLLLDNSEGGINVDRIDERVPVEFRGGSLYAFGGGVEAFGTLRFAEGHSNVVASSMRVSANRVERQVGSTLFLEAIPVAVSQSPDNVGGLLPWMTVRESTSPGQGPYYELFGEVVNGQIRAMNRGSIKADLNAATSNDSVGVPAAGRPILTDDRRVKALLVEHSGVVDLAGYTLTVESGGVSAWYGEIRNGNITAAAGRELILHSGVTLSANIIEGDGGPLTVTTAGGNFSGNNSFTGKLYINENTANFQNEHSLPSGIDVNVLGGVLQATYTPTEVKQMGSLRIAGGGSLTGGKFEFANIELEYGSIRYPKLAGDFPIRKTTIGNASIALDPSSDDSYAGTVTVEDGILTVNEMPAASFEVSGGRLRIEQETAAANAIKLSGGELEFHKLSGPIEIVGPATLIPMRISSSPNHSLDSPLSGDGELSFNSDIQYLDAGDFSKDAALGISRNNPDFTGDVHIHEAAISVYRPQSLGLGDVSVHSGGTLILYNDGLGEGVDFANQVILDGGVLLGNSQSRLTGPLRVASDSYVGGLSLVGSVYLDDAPLATFNDQTTRFLGRLHAGADAKLLLGRRQEVGRGLIELGGVILAEQTNSVLSIVSGGLDELLFTASLHVDAGRSLQLRINDAPMTVAMRMGQSISGNGVLRNDFLLTDGAEASPGASSGTLTVDGDLTISAGGRFRVELAGVQKHDQLIVTGEAVLDGGLLDVSFLDGFLPQLHDEFVILQAGLLTGAFDNAQLLNTIADGWRVDWMLNTSASDLVLQAVSVVMQGDFDGSGVVDGADLAAWKSGFGASAASHRQGDANGDGRVDGADFLVWQSQYGSAVSPSARVAIPEPTSASLILFGLIAALSQRRSRLRWRIA